MLVAGMLVAGVELCFVISVCSCYLLKSSVCCRHLKRLNMMSCSDAQVQAQVVIPSSDCHESQVIHCSSSQEPKLIAGSLDFSEAECFFFFFFCLFVVI
jgi:hypothetical protein